MGGRRMSKRVASRQRLMFAKIVFFAALVFFAGSLRGQAQNVRIERVTACSNNLKNNDTPCVEVNQPFSGLDRRKFSNGRIDFNVQIRGDAESVSFIENNNGVLPVLVAVWINRSRAKADIDIGISQERWEQQG